VTPEEREREREKEREEGKAVVTGATEAPQCGKASGTGRDREGEESGMRSRS
jgi:hypothetical protein